MPIPLRSLFAGAAFAIGAAAAFAQTTPPATPVITSYDATSKTPSFHGTADPGVIVRRDYSTTTQTTARADGTWDLLWTEAPLDAGNYTFSFQAINSAGVSSTGSASAQVTVAVDGPPVMDPLPDQETTWKYREKDYPISIYVHATNQPSRYDATGLPPGTRMDGLNPTLITYTLGGITGGRFNVSVTATNSYGTSAPATFVWTIHPAPKDYIHPDHSIYHPGDTITLSVPFSAPVFVTGTPYIALWNGKKALYSAGSGTDTLQFKYTVTADDPSVQNYVAYDVTLGDGTIMTADGVSAGLHVTMYFSSPPTFSISNPGAQPPVIDTSTWPGTFPDDWLHRTQTAAVGLRFYYVIRATNVPTSYSAQNLPPGLSIDTSAGIIYGFPTAAGNFTITLGATDANGTGTAQINLTVQPPATTAPVIEPIASRDTVMLDANTPPTVNAGDYVEPNTANHNVRVPVNASNTPTAITATGMPRDAVIGPPAQGYFQYNPDNIVPGRYHVTVTAQNSAGSNSTSFDWTAHPAVLGGPHLVNAATTLHAGDTLVINFQFNAPVVVTGAPYVTIHNGAHATYRSGSGTDTLSFQYTIQSGDGTYTDYLPETIELNGGAIATADGISAKTTVSPTHTSRPGQYSVDASGGGTTTPPPTTNPPPATIPPPSASKSNQTITFSSPVSAIMVGHPVTLGATSSAGLPITYGVVSGDATINGNVLTPTSTATLVVRAVSVGSDTVNAAIADVNFGNPQKAAQAITLGTVGGSVPAEKSITLSGTSTSGLPITYTVISGPATISGDTLTFTGTGTVVVRASQAGSGTFASAADATMTFTANPVDRLVNISSRLRVGPDANHIAIAGFVVTGTGPKPMLVRAIGPGLSAFGVADSVANPQLTLTDTTGKVIASNSGWNNDAQISAAGDSIGAFHLAAGSKDAALLVTLAPGAYTAQVSAPSSGSALIEVYDVSSGAAVPTKQLINISTRGAIDAGDSMIGGFVVSGAQSKRVLIRAVGPGLTPFGVAGALSDPMVKVFDASGTVIAQNDNWETAQAVASMPTPATAAQIVAADTAAGAFSLQAGSKDGAVILTLVPGAYTAVVTGANGTSGAALVEIYELNTP